MQPKIGIVICGLEGNHQFVSNPYIQSVRYSHGLPLLLPLVRSEDLLNQYVSLCDGFLFCGGGDITPLLFGESPLPGNGRTSISTDIFQLHLMRQILSSRKPVFAICRGMQLLNVACGGTIWQDFSLIPGKTLVNMQQTDVRSVSVIKSVSAGQDIYGNVSELLSMSTVSTIRLSISPEKAS